MNLATMSANFALSNVTSLCNGGALNLYSGTQPSTPETGLSGNTLLASFTFANPAFGSSTFVGNANEQQTASFSPASVAPTANGTVTWARASVKNAGLSAINWVASTSYAYGNIVVANSALWFCNSPGTSAASGTGPSSQSTSTLDGSARWYYLGASTATTIADFSVSTSGADIIIGNVSLSTTINVTITSFILQIPAV